MTIFGIIFGALSVLFFCIAFSYGRGYKEGHRHGVDAADAWWFTVTRAIDIDSFKARSEEEKEQ